MKTQLFTFLSFVLSFAVLGEVKVQKSPLKSLLIDNASVVTDVTGTDAAKRLEADGGKSWIDGDGRVYRVGRRASFRGLSAVSSDDPNAGTVNWSFEYPGAEWCVLDFDSPSQWRLAYERMEDVENEGAISQEPVQYVYEGTAPWSASSVTMKREHYNEEFVLSLTFVTNAADRLATTGEVARIASSLTGGLTTNDVCAIVTNEVVVESKWVVAKKSPMSGLYTIGEPYYIGEEREMGFPEWAFYMQSTNVWGGLEMDGLDYADGGENATYLYFNSTGLEMQKKIATRNALGLAMAKDVEKKFAEATNAIPSIVTNEVVVVSEWSAWSYTYLNFIEPNYDPYIDVQSLEWVESGNVEDCTFPCWKGVFTGKGWNGGYFTSVAYSGYDLGRGGRDSEEVILYTGAICDEGFKARRDKIEKRANALGLAMAKDIGTVWDSALGVAWEARMHNGHLYYIAVTNRQEVK